MYDAAVEVRNLRKVFNPQSENPVVALDRVSLEVADNEFFTLLGPSGCGKTTLLRLVAGFETATDGEIFLFGEPIEKLPPHKRPINTVFQQYALFPHMSVFDNIAFGLEMLKWETSKVKETVTRMLELVKMAQFAERKPAQLSGGQQQRIALARALAPNPKVLLLDEPLSALDLKLRQAMRLELKTLQRETGVTFLFVTHDQEEALTMSDRVAVMSAGHGATGRQRHRHLRKPGQPLCRRLYRAYQLSDGHRRRGECGQGTGTARERGARTPPGGGVLPKG